MAYSTGEKLIARIVKQIDEFHSRNTGRVDWRLLNRGRAAQYCVIRPLEVERTTIAFSTELNEYQTQVEVWKRIKKDLPEAVDELEDLMNETKNELAKYRKLDDTSGKIVGSTVTAALEPRQVPDENPRYVVWDLVVTWLEEDRLTYSD